VERPEHPELGDAAGAAAAVDDTDPTAEQQASDPVGIVGSAGPNVVVTVELARSEPP